MKLHLPVILRKAVLACSAVVVGCTLYSGNLAAAADITLTNTDSLSIDYAEPDSITDLEGGTLQLMGDTPLLLSNCGEGDGKTYTLFTGISQLTDKEGHVLPVGSYTVADYFDTTLPGTGFWADSTLVLTDDGTLQLEMHHGEEKAAVTITTRRTNGADYQYYAGVLFENITSSADGGAIYGSKAITLSNNGSVEFIGNSAVTTGFGSGGAICGFDAITLSNNGSVEFIGNSAATTGYSIAYGGAISGSKAITLSNNGSVVFAGNTATSAAINACGGAIYGFMAITLSNNGSVVFAGNTATSTASGGTGGALHISGESEELIISNNARGSNADGIAQQLLFEYNYAKGTSCYGGAISANNGSTLKINNNGVTIFQGNYAHASDWFAEGGAIYKQHGVFSIQNNTSVVFENNYTLQEETLRLQSINAFDLSDAGKEMLINFSAPEGGKVEFRDTVHINVDYNSQSAFHLNNWYEDEMGQQIAQTGDIIFTGAYATTENLSSILEAHGINRQATANEIQLSVTSEIGGAMQLHDGRLIVRDGAIIQTDGITVHSSASGESSPTLMLHHGNLTSYLNYSNRRISITISDGASLELAGQNNARYSAITMSDGSSLIVNVDNTHTTNAALTLNSSTLTISGALTFKLNLAEDIAEGQSFALLTGVTQPTNWSASNITVTCGTESRDVSYDDLYWAANTLWLYYDSRPDLQTATWSNESADGKWNITSRNWKQDVYDYEYKDGVAVVFGDTAAGGVTLVGELSPDSVLVNNSEGHDYTWEADPTIGGSLTGGMSLTKQGSGTLTITTNNSYTGGTTIEGGRLEIGHANALGTGTITLNGGTLDLNSYAVGNDIFATGGTLEGGDNFGGKLTVNGDLTLGGETTAGGGILLQGGSISGGSIVDTDITVDGVGDMEISSDIRGNSSLTLNNGDLTISGSNNDYTGGTTINNGNLTIGSGSSLGSGDITLNGGTLNTKGQEITNNIVNNGGTLISSYILGEGHTLTVGKGGMSVVGNLTLAGGNLHFKGMPLSIDGKVTSTAPIEVLVCGYSVIDADGTVQLADFGNNTVGVTAASFNNVGYGTLSYDETKNTLSITLTDKNIWVGGKGANWVQGLNVGWQDYETFEAGNRVVFNTKGTVKIEGGVEPASVLVDIDKSLSFSTKYDKKTGLYSGTIIGNGCVVKRGVGKLTMNDGNSYTGGTFIEAGTVNAKGTNSFGTGAITLSGGTLNLASKAVANDITLNGAATIKSGKKFLGSYTQTGGELMKGSVLNVAEEATISGGTVNGTLSGVGTVTIDGDVELGLTGKITTDKLLVDGKLSVSSKGLAMNAKTSAIEINGGMLTSKGKVSDASLKLNGGSLILSGALSVKDLTLGSGTLTLDGAKLATVKVGNSMTLEGGTTLNLGFNVKAKDEGKGFKIFTFKTIDESITDTALNELLGLGTDAATLAFDSKRKAITLTVTDAEAWNEYAESVRNGTWTATPSEDDEFVESAGVAAASFMLARPAAAVDPMLDKVADTLVQSTWGTAGASRSFGDTIAARGTHATALADGKAAAWISTMGGSSRISSDGGHAGADYTLTGAAFGMEASLSEKSTIGLAIGNSWGKVSTFSAFPVDQDSTHQGIYGKHLLGSSTTLSWMAAHTRTESDAKLAGMACDWTQDALQLDARVDKLFAISDRTTVSAFVGMQYLATDKGECNGLSTGSLQNLRGEIGVSAAHKATDKAYVYGELSFIGDMVRHNPTATVGDYRSRGANPGRAGLNLSAGASYQLNDSWSLNGSYSLELMQNQTSHSANVGATYSF